MKKAIGLFLATTLAISSLSAMALAEDKINVVVNGNAIDFTGNQEPVIQDSRVLVPFRAVFEEMGATVNWDADTKLCEADYNSASVGIKIGETTVTLDDGATVESDVPAQIINGRTMVPLRILSESIGAKVDWDGNTKTVTIEAPEIANGDDSNDTDVTEEDSTELVSEESTEEVSEDSTELVSEESTEEVSEESTEENSEESSEETTEETTEATTEAE